MLYSNASESAQATLDIAWQLTLAIGILIGFSFVPVEAIAQTNVGGALGDVLCNVVGWFTGRVGRAIAILAIIIIGIGALMGKISWGLALIVGLGIALVFGAASIVDAIAGGDGEDCTDATNILG